MSATALPVPAATSNWKRAGWVLLLLGGLFAAGNAVMFLLVDGASLQTQAETAREKSAFALTPFPWLGPARARSASSLSVSVSRARSASMARSGHR